MASLTDDEATKVRDYLSGKSGKASAPTSSTTVSTKPPASSELSRTMTISAPAAPPEHRAISDAKPETKPVDDSKADDKPKAPAKREPVVKLAAIPKTAEVEPVTAATGRTGTAKTHHDAAQRRYPRGTRRQLGTAGTIHPTTRKKDRRASRVAGQRKRLPSHCEVVVDVTVPQVERRAQSEEKAERERKRKRKRRQPCWYGQRTTGSATKSQTALRWPARRLSQSAPQPTRQKRHKHRRSPQRQAHDRTSVHDS